MNAIQVLLKDHEEIKDYFRQYEEASKRAKQTRQRLIEESLKDLDAHMAIEERIFYPAVRAKAKGELLDRLLEGIEEHGVGKFLAQQLKSVGLDDETADAKFQVLMEIVQDHVKEEEKQMFPEAKKLLAGELDALGAQMEALHKQLEG